ncbi:MAG: DOMON domain-containing protein, partial [Candidatus Hodarchaeales archaeon]
MTSRKTIILVLFVSLSILITSTNSTKVESNFTSATESVTVSYVNPSDVNVDGIITPGEYPSTFIDTITDMQVSFSHNGTFIFVGLFSPGTGWLSIGFGPEGVGMNEANIIMGYIKDDTLTWEDHYGQGTSHFNDINNAGTNDLGESAGVEDSVSTIVEFSFPLSSGDTLDHNFVAGETYGFYVAHHPTADDLTSYHPEHSNTIPLYIETTAIIMPKTMNPQVTIDGVINEEEYEQRIFDPTTETKVSFHHNETMMFVGLEAPYFGWIGIGFGPTGVGMNGSNIIIGFVDQSGLSIQDNFGIPDDHLPDVTNGGTDDIVASEGTENATHTIIEFIYPLATADYLHDYNFTLGETYGFFLSHSNQDDFVSMHPEHSITYDFFISDTEQLNAIITLTVTNNEGTPLASGESLLQGSSININAILSFSNRDNSSLRGVLLNFYINSTFGLKKVSSNFTDSSRSHTF